MQAQIDLINVLVEILHAARHKDGLEPAASWRSRLDTLDKAIAARLG